MVRIVRSDVLAGGPAEIPIVSGWIPATWESGPLARWLERDGYGLAPRDCCDGSWAVVAEKPLGGACVVATGLKDAQQARAWIRRERRIPPRVLRSLLASA